MRFSEGDTIHIGGTTAAQSFLASMSKPMDFEENKEASRFVEEHYYELRDFVAKTLGNKVADPDETVHDVWISLRKSEVNGCGYNPNNGTQGDIITVAQFVYGRLKKYCLKVRYSTNGALERYADESDMGSAGVDYDPEVVNFVTHGQRKVVKNKNASVEVSASSSDGLQYIYDNAADLRVQDDLEAVEEFASIRANIDELFNWDGMTEVEIKPFLLSLGASQFDTVSTKSLQSMFHQLGEFAKENDIFGEALKSIIHFSQVYPHEYKVIVASI